MVDAAPAVRSWDKRIGVRFGATLVANLLRAGLAFIAGVLVARGLGASGYGDLNFLLGSFAAVSQLLEMGTSSAFYTFISRRPQTRLFIAVYLTWMAFQFLVTCLVLGLVLPRDIIERVWVGHQRGIVLVAFGANFLMTQVWGMISQLGEARRETVLVQAAVALQAVGHLILVATALHWKWLSVHAVLWLIVGEYLLLTVWLGPRLVRANIVHEAGIGVEDVTVIKELAAYCKPLIVYGWVGFFYAFADRWLLQEFGGSEQQGFFAIGQQFANISLIVTTSMLKVFWKEIAEAQERQDHWRVQSLYHAVSWGLYAVGAWISCLFIPYSGEILSWTVGPGYEGAWFCTALLFLFPVHQALGQIQGTFLYASGDTRSYTRISLLMMIASIPITYLVLAPGSATLAGLGLGAVGLALKDVMLQIIGVNLQAHVIAQTNRWNFRWRYQALVLGVLLGLAWACKWTSQNSLEVIGATTNPSLVTLLGSSLYIVLSLALLLLLFPWIAGLRREQTAPC